MPTTPDPNGCEKCGRPDCPKFLPVPFHLGCTGREEECQRRCDDCNAHAVDWRALYFAAVLPASEWPPSMYRCVACGTVEDPTPPTGHGTDAPTCSKCGGILMRGNATAPVDEATFIDRAAVLICAHCGPTVNRDTADVAAEAIAEDMRASLRQHAPTMVVGCEVCTEIPPELLARWPCLKCGRSDERSQ